MHPPATHPTSRPCCSTFCKRQRKKATSLDFKTTLLLPLVLSMGLAVVRVKVAAGFESPQLLPRHRSLLASTQALATSSRTVSRDMYAPIHPITGLLKDMTCRLTKPPSCDSVGSHHHPSRPIGGAASNLAWRL